jgi:hypothetical protein
MGERETLILWREKVIQKLRQRGIPESDLIQLLE